MISVAIALRKATSSWEKPRGSRARTSSTPNGRPWPRIGTLTLLTTPSSSRNGAGLKRVSAAMSSTIVGSPVRRVYPAFALSPMGIWWLPTMPSGRPAPATMVRLLSVVAELEDAATVDAERGRRRRHRLGHERAEVVALEREAAELCDGLLLARVARDLLLGAGSVP